MTTNWWIDARDATRGLTQARGLAATVVLTLGAGLALSVAVMTVARAYVWRGLPYPEAERLYSVQWAPPNERLPPGLDSLDWSALGDLAEHAVAWDLDVFYLLGGRYPESLSGAWVTPGFSEVFGVRAAMGRGFEPADFEAGRPPVALISDRLWRTRFAGDPGILGRAFDAYVSDRPEEPEQFTIVGVMPAGFWHFNTYTEVLAPLTALTYPYNVRLKHGVTGAALADRIAAIVRAGGVAAPDGWAPRVVSTHASYVAAVRPVLGAVAAAAALVLLIACANAAVLLLVRGHRRQRELAVRMALGASHGRLLRLGALEALVLGSLATTTGLVGGAVAMRMLAPWVEPQFGRRVPGGLSTLGLDATVSATAVAIGAAAIALASLVPLLLIRRSAPAPVLASGRTTTDGPRAGRARAAFLIVEVAASLALVTGALLTMTSARRMLDVDLGFTTNVLTAGTSLRQRTYPDPPSLAAYFERLLARLAPLVPGGRVAAADWWPLQEPRPRDVSVSGSSGASSAPAGLLAVTPGYFDVLGIRLVDGRGFSDHDRVGGEMVAIASLSLARRLWPDARAVGQVLRIPAGEDANAPDATSVTIVGVVQDVKQTHADQQLHDLYLPFLQRPDRFAFVYLGGPGATALPVATLREEAVAAGSEAAIGQPRVLSDVVAETRAPALSLAGLLAGLAVAASVLALVGLYGVVAYTVRQREREIAMRMALGADRRRVVSLFVAYGWRIVLPGLAIGVAAAFALGRVLESQLFSVSIADPAVLATAVVSLTLGALAAVWWPARRAAALDPATLLRSE